jgi:hypothetical protein
LAGCRGDVFFTFMKLASHVVGGSGDRSGFAVDFFLRK